ncbi:type II secretion system minor pseudopilin GspK [Thiomonas sp.]|jgi:general secretion pathway protein K|uniref:type II secretion system minor pseudopilin GspK n=1 Tax=Thiomonas sp. TaxID=2047785 RepID=UPI0026399FF5|nr:type II secretion system minor pseudopilin GspK [Thiomonas sp.]
MSRPSRSAQRGAALITAMLIAALAAVMVSGMFWSQWSAISREQTAREQTQARWILRGAIDWARLILREDARNSAVDYLGEPWSVPLAEARLSTFLAARGQDSAALPDAWLEGRIIDAQSRFNLRDLAPAGSVDPQALRVLQRLCAALQLPAGVATDIANGVAASTAPVAQPSVANAPLPLQQLQDLARLGTAVAQALPRLAPAVTLLPQPTAVNANTAAPLVLAALLGVDADTAQALVQARKRAYFRNLGDIALLLPQGTQVNPQLVSVATGYFDAIARVRIGHLEYAERALIQRAGLFTQVVRIERVPPWLAAPAQAAAGAN